MRVSAGEVDYAIHFHFQQGTMGREVLCFVHSGPCKEKTRPCGTESSSGIATCSRKDTFVRAIGRKVALQRALRGIPRAQRSLIWEAYYQQAHKPKGRKG